jgi:hypothetical protein
VVPPDVSIHYPVFPDYFPRAFLSRAIQSGSFFVGRGAPPTDVDAWGRATYPDHFPRPFLSRAIQSGSFTIGEIWITVVPPDVSVHYPIFPDYLFVKPALSKAIYSGSFFVGSGAPPTDKDTFRRVIHPDYFPKAFLSRAIQSGSFAVGEIWKNDVSVHYPVFADYLFIRRQLSRAIQSGSFFVGEGVPPKDKDAWRRSIYPDYFPKAFLSRAIQSGSFAVGEIWKVDRIKPCVVFPDYFPKAFLSRAIQSGILFTIVPDQGPAPGDIVFMALSPDIIFEVQKTIDGDGNILFTVKS